MDKNLHTALYLLLTSNYASDIPILPSAVDWTMAMEDWGVAWPIHTYLSASVFCLLSLWALIYFFRVGFRYLFVLVLNIFQGNSEVVPGDDPGGGNWKFDLNFVGRSI